MKGIDLKKKVGPLPIWGWALGGAGTLGVVYYLYKSNSSSTTSTTAAQTNADLAAEQAAADQAGGVDGGGGDSGGAGAPTLDTTGLATGSTSTDQLESDLETLQTELASLSNGALTSATPSTTITGEAQDLLAAQQALQALGLGGIPAAPKGASSAAKGKVSTLPIITQLEDIQAGLLAPSALGPNAAAALNTANGNVTAALAARAAAATTPAKTPTPPKPAPKQIVPPVNIKKKSLG